MRAGGHARIRYGMNVRMNAGADVGVDVKTGRVLIVLVEVAEIVVGGCRAGDGEAKQRAVPIPTDQLAFVILVLLSQNLATAYDDLVRIFGMGGDGHIILGLVLHGCGTEQLLRKVAYLARRRAVYAPQAWPLAQHVEDGWCLFVDGDRQAAVAIEIVEFHLLERAANTVLRDIDASVGEQRIVDQRHPQPLWSRAGRLLPHYIGAPLLVVGVEIKRIFLDPD